MADVYISKPFVKKEDKKELVKEVDEKKDEKQTPFKLRKSLPFNPFSPFGFLPKGVDFETRDKEEKVILILRRHPITNLRWVIIAVLMSLAPFLLRYFPIMDFLPSNFRFISLVGWYMLVFAYAFESFLSWFFAVNIVTDERIIDIDFYNLIYKEVSDTNLDKIQDVTYKVGGVLGTLLNYGNVLIQTAGEVPRFEFNLVPRPEKVAEILQKLREEEEQEKIEGRVR